MTGIKPCQQGRLAGAVRTDDFTSPSVLPQPIEKRPGFEIPSER